MSEILISQQNKIPYTSVSVAQINEALVSYAQDQTITAGLEALKTAIIEAIPDAAACPQCGGASATGKITVGAVVYICPLCEGMTKTEGIYLPVTPPVIGFKTI